VKRLIVFTAALIAALSVGAGVASSAGQATTVTHYTASYSCDCFGTFQIAGVHITNIQFPGLDSGGGGAVGGRDNFSGTVSLPPASEVVLSGSSGCGPDEAWYSDYDGQATCSYYVAIEPDGSLKGWAVYPAA
jgi:hypothetical protein